MPEVIANLNKMKCRVVVRKLASRDVPVDSDNIIIETATSDSEDDSANKTVCAPPSPKEPVSTRWLCGLQLLIWVVHMKRVAGKMIK